MSNDERVEVTLRLPVETKEMLMKISELACVTVDDAFNVLLALTLVNGEVAKPPPFTINFGEAP